MEQSNVNKQEWQASADGVNVRVVNAWRLPSPTEVYSYERVWINGNLVMDCPNNSLSEAEYRNKIAEEPMQSVIAKEAAHLLRSRHQFTVGDDTVEVRLGTAWYLFGVACKICVNGKFAGGNRVVLFA